MFVVLLRFSLNKPQAAQWMAAHNDWLQRGFNDGVFVLSGSLLPHSGGAIIAHDLDRDALEARIASDPFVENDIVVAEIIEIAASRTDSRLDFLKAMTF